MAVIQLDAAGEALHAGVRWIMQGDVQTVYRGELEAMLAGLEASLGNAIFVSDNATVVKGWRERIWERIPAAGLLPLGKGAIVHWGLWQRVGQALEKRRTGDFLVLSVESHIHGDDEAAGYAHPFLVKGQFGRR